MTNSFSASSVDFPYSKTLIQLVLHFQSFLDMATELHLMKWISLLKCNLSQGGWGQEFLVGALIESRCPKLDIKTIKMETWFYDVTMLSKIILLFPHSSSGALM